MAPIFEEFEKDKDRRFTKDEQYVSDCLSAINEVEDLYKQLNQSIYFLTNFRTTKNLKNVGITRFDYIVYNVESYLYRVTGILDRVLILCNVVYNIGLLDKQCTIPKFFESGKDNDPCKIIKNSNPVFFAKLNDLKDLIGRYSNKRNEIVHRKRYYDESIRVAELLNIVIESNNTTHDKLEAFKHRRSVEQNQVTAAFKKEFHSFNTQIRDSLDSIYTDIEVIFNTVKATL